MARGIIIPHPAGSYRRLSFNEWKNAIRLYRQGLSGMALSRRFHISCGNILSGLRRRGIAIRNSIVSKRLAGHEWRVIRRMYAFGQSARQIAEGFGLPHSTIVRGLRSRGVPIRQRMIPRIHLSASEKAYIAGLFDGEGHITVGRNWRERRRMSHWIQIGITNTHLPIIKFLLRKLKGNMGCNTRSPLSLKPCWHWNASSRHATLVLRMLLPHLRIKKKRADLALRLQARIVAYGLGKPLDDHEVSARERIRLKIQRLNGRGVFVGHPKEEKKRYDYLKQFASRNAQKQLHAPTP